MIFFFNSVVFFSFLFVIEAKFRYSEKYLSLTCSSITFDKPITMPSKTQNRPIAPESSVVSLLVIPAPEVPLFPFLSPTRMLPVLKCHAKGIILHSLFCVLFSVMFICL